MTNTELLSLLCEALELPPGSLQGSTEIAGVEEWTSLAWLTIMSLADSRLGVQLSAGQIRQCRTVADVVKILQP